MRMERSRFKGIFCITAILFVVAFGSASATENGGGAYPNGAVDFMGGAPPPPGTYLINYLTYYTADKIKDGNHRNVVPNLELAVTADVARLIHVTDKKIFGAFYGVQLLVPVVNVDVTLPNVSQVKSGLGDIVVSPLFLSWHGKNWHFASGIDVFVPTGSYGKFSPANPGRNYWTFEPVFAFTFFSDGGFDVSSKIMYDINTKNADTNYKSGHELHADYTIAQRFGSFNAGIGGYYYKQITSDRQNWTKVGSDGNKGQVFAIGPQVKYDHKTMSFILKYQHELDVKNRPEGDKFWFQFVKAF